MYLGFLNISFYINWVNDVLLLWAQLTIETELFTIICIVIGFRRNY